MKNEIFKYLIFYFIYFSFVFIANSFFDLSYWLFFVGGLLGMILSNIDHILHIFVYKPQELNSIRISSLFKLKQYKDAINLLYETREERKDLIFHTVLYQIIFAVLTFWVVSSSGNLFTRGLVLGYFLNLVIYNLNKFIKKEWFFGDESQTRIYFATQVILLFVFGLLI